MKLQNFSKKSVMKKPLNLLIANKGTHIYYVEFTDELRLSSERFADGSLIMTFGNKNDAELDLGPVTYIGEL